MCSSDLLVGDNDRVNIGQIFADGGKALGGLAHAQTGVDEDTGTAGGEERRVAGTAAGQHAKLNDGGLPWTLQNTLKRAETEGAENVWGFLQSLGLRIHRRDAEITEENAEKTSDGFLCVSSALLCASAVNGDFAYFLIGRGGRD